MSTRVLKFHIHIPHDQIVDPYFFVWPNDKIVDPYFFVWPSYVPFFELCPFENKI